MAFVSNLQGPAEEDNKDKTLSPSGGIAPVGGSGAVHLSPSGGPVGGASSGAGASGAAPSGAGGSFASLDKYLGANQGQADPLAGKITSGVNQQYSTLQGQNQSTINDINSQVAQNAVPTNYQDTLAQESANPVSFANDTGNVKSFQNLLNASYSGPTSAEGTNQFQTQQAAVNNAIAQGQNATQTEAGRKNLLTQNEAKPTTGVTALNSAILSQSPTALSSVENAYKPFSNLVSGLNTGAQGINATIGKTQGDITSANQASNKQIADQINALNSNVNNEYGALQDKYTSANKQAADYASALQGGTLPTGGNVDAGLQSFLTNSVAPWMTANAPGQSLSYNFANAVPQFTGNTAPTLQQAATAEDYNKAGAFQNLLSGMNFGAATPIIDRSTANQAGTYTTAQLPDVNNKALAGDIQAGLRSGAGPINVGREPFQQYLGLLAALQKYQGLPVAGQEWGPEWLNQNQQYVPNIA